MASGYTDFGENRVVDAVFGGQPLNPPAIWYISLYKTAFGETGGGTEVTGGGYARIAVPNSLASFSLGVNGVKTNSIDLVSEISTGAWGTIVAMGFADSLIGGNVWSYADINPEYHQNIDGPNQQWVLRANALTLTQT